MIFSRFEPYAGDPILTLNEEFRSDARPDKINLGIGVYTDDKGLLPVMAAVREIAPSVVRSMPAWGYQPMAGNARYRQAVEGLLFGEAGAAALGDRLATVQSLGGSGALKVGADMLARHIPDAEVWISDPTWDNHRSIFEGAGFQVNTYPYYDPATGSVRFDDMLDTLSRLPRRSIVVLHACCHNPTGADLSVSQWQVLVDVLQQRALIPFLDAAYLGFGSSLEQDAHAIRAVADAGIEALVALSFSKNFALYGERCGALTALCASAADRSRVFGQMQLAVRRIYSSPPLFGSQVIAEVLSSGALRSLWEDELASARARIVTMRLALHAALVGRMPQADFSYLLNQRGMFSYTGLTPIEVDQLKRQHGLYVIRSGRMCVAGLNDDNVSRVANAIADVLGQRTA